jgi:hypothetical protein
LTTVKVFPLQQAFTADISVGGATKLARATQSSFNGGEYG